MMSRSNRTTRWPRLLALLSVGAGFLFFAVGSQKAARPLPPKETFTALGKQYQSKIQPLLKRYCYRCHTGADAEAEIDLSNFKTIADIRKTTKVWLKVREMLDSRQMPPPRSKQPEPQDRQQLEQWVKTYLTAEARLLAGDPGPTILRRLNNPEYNYTIRDLTGIHSLNPTSEFPVDGAAGEGFTNSGAAQGMSPSLVTKYLDAAKEIASHAVLTPTGIRFSQYATRRDKTNELLGRIQAFYRQFTEDGGGTAVNLHGIQFSTNQGGRLPLKRYLSATLEERERLKQGAIEEIATRRHLSSKYLARLWKELSAKPSNDGSLLDQLRKNWRITRSNEPSKLIQFITTEQKKLWKFNSIGHIGRLGGPSRWMEMVGARNSIVTRTQIKMKLPSLTSGDDISIYLATTDAGDGNQGDYVVWKNLRIEGGGKPPLPLHLADGLMVRIHEQRKQFLQRTTDYLTAASTVISSTDVSKLAKEHKLDVRMLKNWLKYLARANPEPVKVEGHFTRKLTNPTHRFITGWGTGATPSIIANSSDRAVRIPGLAREHSIVAHPSPTLYAAVGWQSPIDGTVQITASIVDAHHACGNGIQWWLQHRSGDRTSTVWAGDYNLRGSARLTPTSVTVRKGDLISLLIGPRNRSHVCDLTMIDLKLTETGGAKRTWDLAHDLSPNIQESNPHSDRYGNKSIWHLYKGRVADIKVNPGSILTVPPKSTLAQWINEPDLIKKRALAQLIQQLAIGPTLKVKDTPDAVLQSQLRQLPIPLDLPSLMKGLKSGQRFGRHPLGETVAQTVLIIRAPTLIEIRVPAELASGRSLMGSVELDATHGKNGTVQVLASTSKPSLDKNWPTAPVMICEGSKVRERLESPLARFCNLFPPALCYARIVPVDEVVTLTLFHREDDYLRRLILNDQQIRELDRLWDELYFVSREPLKLVVAFEQIWEFAPQARPDRVKAFQPMRKPIQARARAFRQRSIQLESTHLSAVLRFADRAWRRKLTNAEQQSFRRLYQKLRKSEISHDQAVRLMLARALTSPNFLYRREKPDTGQKASPVSNLELANRLSYFLWSSMPDSELRRIAESNKLTSPKSTLGQVHRMLKDKRIRRLAIQFACQWLHIRNFDQNADKNEKLYPNFPTIRGTMYEESIRFFEDMFRNDRSILDLINANHTFLNNALAKHYGIPGVKGSQWRRVDGVQKHGRGGVLGMGTVLASQSGASRTSPILRGNWVFETLLGERLPRPPAKVPQLPEKVPQGLTARQLIEKHSSVPACARCHSRIDPYGFALEQYDAIGRLRPYEVRTKTRLPDGVRIEGLQGLRNYLIKHRQDDVVRQFCRKLLGFALGRAVQLSDEPLLAEMQSQLKANNYRFSVAVKTIVSSRQFREIRGIQFSGE